MTDFDKQVPKEGWQNANAKYMGPDKEPKPCKNGATFCKLRFHIDGKEKENKFTLFSPLKSNNSKYKDVNELVLYQSYNLAWREKAENHDGNEWVSKTIQILGDPKEEVVKQINNQPQATPEPQSVPQQPTDNGSYVQLKLPNDEQLKQFSGDYIGTVPPNEQSATDFVGSMLRTFNPDADVLKGYLEHYKNNVK